MPERGEWFWKDVERMADWCGGEERGVQPVLVDVIDRESFWFSQVGDQTLRGRKAVAFLESCRWAIHPSPSIKGRRGIVVVNYHLSKPFPTCSPVLALGIALTTRGGYASIPSYAEGYPTR
jgi:hypothetical protein